MPFPEAIVAPLAAQSIKDGRFIPSGTQVAGPRDLLNELFRRTAALESLREA